MIKTRNILINSINVDKDIINQSQIIIILITSSMGNYLLISSKQELMEEIHQLHPIVKLLTGEGMILFKKEQL